MTPRKTSREMFYLTSFNYACLCFCINFPPTLLSISIWPTLVTLFLPSFILLIKYAFTLEVQMDKYTSLDHKVSYAGRILVYKQFQG